MPRTKKRDRDRETVDSSLEESDGRFFVELLISKSRFQALVDPGAHRSYINEKMASYGQAKNWKFTQTYHETRVADGVHRELDRKTIIVCKISGKQLNIKFHVMPDLPHDFLLGMDTLKKLNIKVFLNDKVLNQTKLHTGNEICAVAGVREFSEARN
uniref:Retropepsins domain-containing protein n=1 Tax=Trichogramma kaykai TaxID=54128 RepID=A0ABD2W250_9HYME